MGDQVLQASQVLIGDLLKGEVLSDDLLPAKPDLTSLVEIIEDGDQSVGQTLGVSRLG